MITRYQNFNEMVQSAQNAIDKYNENGNLVEKKKMWLQKILDALKKRQYVTIQTLNGKKIDVERIAGTFLFASFFDVINQTRHFNVNVEPVIAKELRNYLF